MNHFLTTLIVLISILTFPAAAFAEDLEMVNRPVNASGLTGLFFTTMPFTIPQDTVEVGISVISENSTAPDFTLGEYPISITSALGDNSSQEIALKGQYFQKTEADYHRKRGLGNIELSYKWNFLPQIEYSTNPAMALIATGIVPIADENANLDRINHWGSRMGVSIGSEVLWREHVIGCYADSQFVLKDLSNKQTRDSYIMANAGLLFPISKYRNLQMLVEYSMVNGKRRLNVESADYSAITYGLRLVNERFNISMGTQFLRKQIAGYNNSGKVIGTISMKF